LIAIITMLRRAVAALARPGQGEPGPLSQRIKQMNVAAFMYSTDHGKMVAYNSAGGTAGAWVANFIDYYSKATNLFKCATANRPAVSNAGNSQGSADQIWGRDYKLVAGGVDIHFEGGLGFNGWFFSDRGGDPDGSEDNKFFSKDSAVRGQRERRCFPI
jgi:hypothetical protein